MRAVRLCLVGLCFFALAGAANPAAEPLPVGRLLGKQAGMFEIRRTDFEGQRFVANRPRLRKLAMKLPTAAAALIAMINAIASAPA